MDRPKNITGTSFSERKKLEGKAVHTAIGIPNIS